MDFPVLVDFQENKTSTQLLWENHRLLREVAVVAQVFQADLHHAFRKPMRLAARNDMTSSDP